MFKHETNTFSPLPTPLEAFGRYGADPGPAYGAAALAAYKGTNEPVAAYIDVAEEQSAELVFPIAAEATPSGSLNFVMLFLDTLSFSTPQLRKLRY